MKYRYLFASDMDFTLLMPGEDVTEENKKAIRLLRENGVAFTLATGRTFYLVRKFAASLDVDVPCITSNGGSLYDPKKFDEVYSVNIDETVARDVFEMLLRRDIDFAGYSGEGIFFGPRNGRRDFFDKYNEGLKEEEKAPLYDFSLDMKPFPKFSKILVVGADEETKAILRGNKDLECTMSTGVLMDLTAPGASKGNALLKLAEMLEIPEENVFAAGDNDNDLSMLKAAPHSIAMGNSSDEIKACCEYVTTNCEENGLAKAVYDFILPRVRPSS